ncbi:hypothetical protein HMI54_014445 [Coelomomyces lativittatus]|nr:hypothetical protein HMI56_002868 [Coelomomyces lativittatus]KAJ1514129.1 hypothetical protein HMI54_014445 [Coelomomyces lativittatus]
MPSSSGNDSMLSKYPLAEPCYLAKIFLFPDRPKKPIENEDPAVLQSICDYRVLLEVYDKTTVSQIKERTKEILGNLYPYLFPYLFRIIDEVSFQVIHKGGICLLHDSIYLTCLKHEEYDLYMTMGIQNFHHYMFIHLPEWKQIREEVNARESIETIQVIEAAQGSIELLKVQSHEYLLSPCPTTSPGSPILTDPDTSFLQCETLSTSDLLSLKTEGADSSHQAELSSDFSSSSDFLSDTDSSCHNSSEKVKNIENDEEDEENDEEDEEDEEEDECEDEEEEEIYTGNKKEKNELNGRYSGDESIHSEKNDEFDDDTDGMEDSMGDEDDEEDELPPFPFVPSPSHTSLNKASKIASSQPITLDDVVPSIKFISPEVYGLSLSSTTSKPNYSSKKSKPTSPHRLPSPTSNPPEAKTVMPDTDTSSKLQLNSQSVKDSSAIYKSFAPNKVVNSSTSVSTSSISVGKVPSPVNLTDTCLGSTALTKVSEFNSSVLPDTFQTSNILEYPKGINHSKDVNMTDVTSSDHSLSELSDYSGSEESTDDQTDSETFVENQASVSPSLTSMEDTSDNEEGSKPGSFTSAESLTLVTVTPTSILKNEIAPLMTVTDTATKRKDNANVPLTPTNTFTKKSKLDSPVRANFDLKVMRGASPSLKAMISSGAFNRLKHLPTFTVPEPVSPCSSAPSLKAKGDGGKPSLNKNKADETSDAFDTDSSEHDSSSDSTSDSSDSNESDDSTSTDSEHSDNRIRYAKSSNSSQRSKRSFLSTLSSN